MQMHFTKIGKKFLDFYFNGLAYPRVTVNELLVICQKYGFTLKE